MKRTRTFLPVLIATAAIASTAIAGCSTATAGTPAGGAFAGYKWQVVTITHAGKQTPIPARYNVYLSFGPGAQFGANEPVNYHSGTYHLADGGFSTSALGTTLVAYGGKDPIVFLSVDAVSAFDPGVHATAAVTGAKVAVNSMRPLPP